MVAVLLFSCLQITVSCYTVFRSVALYSSRAMRGTRLIEKDCNCCLQRGSVTCRSEGSALYCERRLIIGCAGVRYPSVSALIPSLLLLHKKTEPDPQSPDEMDLTLVSDTHSRRSNRPRSIFPQNVFIEAIADNFDCVSLSGAMGWQHCFCLDSGSLLQLQGCNVFLFLKTSWWISYDFIINTGIFVIKCALSLSCDIQCVACLFSAAGTKLWSNIMEILEEKDGVDTELLVYAMTLINKVRKRPAVLRFGK